MEFCQKEQIPVDFVTRHHYTTEEPHQDGHYQYQKLADPEAGFANLQTTRDIIDSFEEYRGLEIHITEFNTSYVPDNPLHDTNQNAAYIAQQLSRLGDMNESYSYWTFGDIFEEKGVPFAPFHGGFGLVANGCIPKPTFWTFQFYQQLSGQCIHRSEDDVILKDGDGWNGILWNSSLKRTGCTKHMSFQIDHPQGTEGQEYLLLTKTVDETTCNPLKLWHEMGEPRSLTENQKELLRECARPQLRSRTVCEKDGRIELTFDVEEFGVEYFTLIPVTRTPDRGYDYARVMRTEWGEV
jgi:xylan 1,4-beta-xylosidase